jgi:hypothetical protein
MLASILRQESVGCMQTTAHNMMMTVETTDLRDFLNNWKALSHANANGNCAESK